MTTPCHILDCTLPADIADASLNLCAQHYRSLVAVVPESEVAR